MLAERNQIGTLRSSPLSKMSDAIRLVGREFLSERFLAVVAKPPPPSVVSIRDRMGPVRSQRGSDTCATFAVSSALEFFYPGFVPSVAQLQHETERAYGDCTAGSPLEHVLNAAKIFGVISEDLWPFNPQVVCYDPEAEVKNADRKKIKHWLDVTNLAISFPGIKSRHDLIRYHLIGAQAPILISVVIPEKDGERLYNWFFGPYIEKPSHNLGNIGTISSEIGWHAIALTGFDDNTGYFEFKNSWGSWGNGGYGYLPYEYVDALTLGLYSISP